MKWSSAVSVEPDTNRNLAHCIAEIQRELPEPPDLALLFVSDHFSKHYAHIGREVYRQLGCRHLLGCSAGGVIGAGQEVEGMPGISLTAAVLPDVRIHPFQLEHGALPSLDGSPRPWEELFGVTAEEEPAFLLLADPYTFSAESCLSGLDFAFPGSPKVGGLASAARRPGENALFIDGQCHRGGLVGLAVSGDIVLDTAVAQGCYPVGPVLCVTDCEDNVLRAVDERPVLEVLGRILSDMTPEQQELVQHSLFIGIAMDPMKESFSHGDFLIRNLLGADTDEGCLLIAARLHQGQMVQFHLRDASSSASDLDDVISAFIRAHNGISYYGALLFSCLGRGQGLYGRANHDSERFQHFMGRIPLGGFFCNGEIGPVGAVTYLHGYTSSFGIFRPRR